MFTTTSNTTFNNTLFNGETMPKMHASMLKLYKFADDNHKVVGQSALARKLKESPQTVKNWESRGISEGGALNAQNVLGCNANWLLDKCTTEQAPESPSGMLIAAEKQRDWGWPFQRISRAEYGLLTSEEREHIEDGIVLLVKNRGQPEKQNTPAIKIANG
jgi:hypothetical protein